MGFNVKLAASGIQGVTTLTPREITRADNSLVLAVDSVNVFSDNGTRQGDFSLNLPPDPIQSGSIIEFKNLLTEGITGVTIPAAPTGNIALATSRLVPAGNNFIPVVANAVSAMIQVGDVLTFGGTNYTVTIVTPSAVLPRIELSITPVTAVDIPLGGAVTTNRPLPAATSFTLTQGTITETITIVAGQSDYMTTAAFTNNAPITGAFDTGAMFTPTIRTNTNMVTVNNNSHNIDGLSTVITTNTRNQIFRLVYVNNSIGWAAI